MAANLLRGASHLGLVLSCPKAALKVLHGWDQVLRAAVVFQAIVAIELKVRNLQQP